MNPIEALKEGDCFGIGLSIARPECAIADPSRVIVKDIIPTYMTVDSFLESAKFKLANMHGQDQKVHGGFKGKDSEEKDAQVALGVGRENITGLLPLYLFKEHWSIAKRKIPPLFGFMCTLDVFGYNEEQLTILPFTVLATAIQKAEDEPTDNNKKMLAQILATCQNIISSNKNLRADVVRKIISFSKLNNESSARTADVIKGINVLAAQFYTLLSVDNYVELINDEGAKADFSNQEKLTEIKKNFVRFAAEEQLRRMQQHPEKLLETLTSVLYPEFQSEFINPTWAKRK